MGFVSGKDEINNKLQYTWDVQTTDKQCQGNLDDLSPTLLLV